MTRCRLCRSEITRRPHLDEFLDTEAYEDETGSSACSPGMLRFIHPEWLRPDDPRPPHERMTGALYARLARDEPIYHQPASLFYRLRIKSYLAGIESLVENVRRDLLALTKEDG